MICFNDEYGIPLFLKRKQSQAEHLGCKYQICVEKKKIPGIDISSKPEEDKTPPKNKFVLPCLPFSHAN